MSMLFSRNDKAPEPAPAAKPAAPAAVAAPIPPKPVAPAPAPASAAPVPPPPPSAPTENRRFQMPASSSAQSVSVISKALKITGQLESTEDIYIEGEVEGDVRGVSVKVSQSAKVHGVVYGDEVEMSGTLNGKIEARKVVLTSTAHISGDVVHQDIRIDSGAFIDGHCRPEFGKPDGKAQAVRKPAVMNGDARPSIGSTKLEDRQVA